MWFILSSSYHHLHHFGAPTRSNHGAEAHQCPSPLLRDVGPSVSCSMEENMKGKEEPEGGPMKWEAQPVRHKNEPRPLSWLVFALPSSISTTNHLT